MSKATYDKYPQSLENRVYFGLVLGYLGHFKWFQGYIVYFEDSKVFRTF